MNKNQFNKLALELMRRENNSKERALEKLDMMEDVCLLQGKHNLIQKVQMARQYIQRTYC